MNDLTVAIAFKGNCTKAIEFYEKVFDTEVAFVNHYNPEDVPGGFENLVSFAMMEIAGKSIMFNDSFDGDKYSGDDKYTKGNHMSLVVSGDDLAQLQEWFARLEKSGKKIISFEKNDAGQWFGIVADKFGVIWQFGMM
ncbi:MAG: VOC family protein [Firmicutes bacterium]|nr:VOC family protein [Bacillota bacterium]